MFDRWFKMHLILLALQMPHVFFPASNFVNLEFKEFVIWIAENAG